MEIIGKIKTWLILPLLVLIGAFVFSPTAHAQNSIIKLNQAVSIDRNSVASITETVEYSFIESRHGIDRYYELVSKTQQSKYYVLNFELISVTQDGVSANYQNGKTGNQYRIRIGDPNIYVSGNHTYQIKYKVWPVVRQDPSGDYINYDVTGNNWQVPIQSASASVTLPSGVLATQTRCYTGPSGSTSQDCQINSGSGTVTATTLSPLGAKEGLTINILTPKNSFDSYLVPQDSPPNDSSRFGGIALLGIGLLIVFCVGTLLTGCIIRLIKWHKKRKAQNNETIVAQYELPKGMTAAQAGILDDNKTGMREITATIVDLAVRGYLKIQKTDQGFAVKILKTKITGLNNYETSIFNVFKDSSAVKESVVEIDQIDRAVASVAIKSAQEQIVNSLVDTGDYHKQKTSTINRSASVAGSIITIIILFVFLPVFALVLLPLISIYLAVQIAKTSDLTAKGYDDWALVKGLKLYLTVAEKDRIKFHEAPSKTPAQFSKLLPAAIALNVEKEWAEQFKSLNISKSVTWYETNDAFNAVLLASIISDGFSSSINDNFSAPSSSSLGSSSGGFSGGGFSGGGDFGGGGGGDW